jgi:hypothetical protein
MIRFHFLLSIPILGAAVAQSAMAQKLDSSLTLTNSERTHEDDLFIGTAKMKLYYSSDGKQVDKEVTVLFVTRDRIIYREKDGERSKTKSGNGSFIKLVQEMKDPKNDREWVWKNGKIAGPIVPPETIDLTPGRLSNQQLTAFLIERAETLYSELDSALATRSKTAVEECLAYADTIRKFVSEDKLDKRVESLFNLRLYAETQDKLFLQLTTEFEAYKKQKLDEAQQREFAKVVYNLRQFQGLIELGTHGANFLYSDELTDLTRAARAFGKISQVAAQQQIQQLWSVQIAKVAEERISKQVSDRIADIQKNQILLAEQRMEAWTILKLDKGILQNLDRLAVKLLNPKTPDNKASLDALDARIRYTQSRGFPSPYLISLRNKLDATNSLERKPAKLADRIKTAEAIFELGKNTLIASKTIPESSLFDVDRVQTWIAGAELIQLAVKTASDPTSPVSDPAVWDIRADYGARVLKMALSRSAVLDTGGHARLTRAMLLLHRGLPTEALAQIERDTGLWENQPGYLLELTRIACANNDLKMAEKHFSKSLKAGLRMNRDLEFDKDFFKLWEIKPKPQFVIDREKPNVAAYFTMNPNTVKNKLQTYDVKLVNLGSYPLVDVSIQCGIVYSQGFQQQQTIFSKVIKVDYIGPGGSRSDEYFWEDAFQLAAPVSSKSIVIIELEPKKPKGNKIQLPYPLQKGIYRHALTGMACDDKTMRQMAEIPINYPTVIDNDVAAFGKSLDCK